MAPIEAAWDAGGARFGRPTIPMDRFVRLMVDQGSARGWGYETLVREVSDSLHLRRFCRIALTERVPDESTIRKLVRRLGPEVIEEIMLRGDRRATGDAGERRFVARAARIDSTVVEADIRYPTDLGLAAGRDADAGARGRQARELAGAGRAARPGPLARRSRGRLRRLNRTIGGPHRPGQADSRCG